MAADICRLHRLSRLPPATRALSRQGRSGCAAARSLGDRGPSPCSCIAEIEKGHPTRAVPRCSEARSCQSLAAHAVHRCARAARMPRRVDERSRAVIDAARRSTSAPCTVEALHVLSSATMRRSGSPRCARPWPREPRALACLRHAALIVARLPPIATSLRLADAARPKLRRGSSTPPTKRCSIILGSLVARGQSPRGRDRCFSARRRGWRSPTVEHSGRKRTRWCCSARLPSPLSDYLEGRGALHHRVATLRKAGIEIEKARR